MERIDLQCNAKNVWEIARQIIFETMQCYEMDLCCDIEQFDQIANWNKARVKPIKFISKVGFYKKDLKGLIVFITKSKNWWRTITTEKDKATLVIYLPKMIKLLAELRKDYYRTKSDEERNI